MRPSLCNTRIAGTHSVRAAAESAPHHTTHLSGLPIIRHQLSSTQAVQYLFLQPLAKVAHDYRKNAADLNPLVVQVSKAYIYYTPRNRMKIKGASQLNFTLDLHNSLTSAFLIYPPILSSELTRTIETETASYLDLYLQSDPCDTEVRTVKGGREAARMRELSGVLRW